MKYINSIFFLILLLSSGQLLAQNGGTEGVEVKNLETVNSEHEDFAPMPYGNKLMYTKAVRKHKIFGPKLKDGTQMFTDVMSSSKGADGKFKAGKALTDDANFKFFDGAPAFVDGGQKMIYSRTDLKGTRRNDTTFYDLKIYEAVVVGDGYKSERELPFNSASYSSTHPTVSTDGNIMYFSSNRPGGYGGMDLWSVEKVDNNWGTPKNLGADVNTANNEIFPHIDAKDNLFYSSNKSGNLDIYVAQEMEGAWAFFGNLGQPFNSGSDDFNYVANADGTEGYFVSARPGGKGYDDIYTWAYNPELIEATIVVVDEETQERLESAKVIITPTEFGNMLDKLYRDSGTDAAETFLTNGEGTFDYSVFPNTNYTIAASKDDYYPKEIETSTLELTENNEYIIPLKPKIVRRNINGLVVDSETDLSIEGARLIVTNLTTGDVTEFTSDKDGKFSFEIDCTHDFKITAEKQPYSGDMVELKGLLEQCKKDGEINVTLRLNPFRLVHVYFDFDKANIRLDESLADLQNLKLILSENKNFTAELRGHTDSRGSTRYNKKLSTRRAKAVVQWLIDNGVDKNTLVAVGLGEAELVNNCSNNVSCSELEHQLNRRTEFKLISKTIEIKEINSSGKKQPRVDPCTDCQH